MVTRLTTPWPTGPRTVFFDDVASPPTLRRALRDERIQRVAPGVWSADLATPAEELIAGNIWQIVGRQFPDAVIVDRSAAVDGRVDGGVVTITTDTRATNLNLPGVSVLVRPIAVPVDDLPWSFGLRMATPARTLVDNLAVTRGRHGHTPRTLSIAEVQDWLARKSITWDAVRMARLRSDAIELASAAGHAERAQRIDELFAELTGEQPLRQHSGRFLQATLAGQAWDDRRVALFDTVAAALQTPSDGTPEWLPPPETDGELPFFEAYFSNYIEGTEFPVEVAREIIETQTPPARRRADGHDILGTHRCVVDPVGRAQTSTDVDALLALLRQRHATILVGRPEMGPGDWKDQNNQVGVFAFVDHQLVEGTLRRGLGHLAALPPGFVRALYLMFVISEVHPFLDGNGRVARLMMNAELSAVGVSRIVVPTVLRNEYISALRRASTQGGDVTALIAVLAFAWRWTSSMPWADPTATEGQLVATNALLDSNDAATSGKMLELP